MTKRKSPRLRTVSKSVSAYPLNKFNSDFPYILGQEIVYLLASKGRADLQGNEWEQIFALCVGADWKPSNVGLDDVVMGNTAWGAKTVKSGVKDFKNLKQVRLISGRNSPVYSYGGTIDTSADPNLIGEQVLEIWNERVSAIREKYKHLRTVVLVKSNDLSQVAVFEFDTIRYDSELFNFEWNKNGNLEGFIKGTRTKQFVWQPHGSQFTIIEKVPEETLILKIKPPETLDKEKILDAIGFDKTWVTIERK
ncbi:hypothetical protein [Mesonia sp. HuA40]|uniref:hypothetical protein n=1 Tax=Mesonia sp. HuA40 TaxID=2602761 RepID=UPI0011C9D7B2|nr:hypothetical protein [Mesonia sp. HuA40]TXK73355.1 hypothetical protein FT993_06115 [Mesonia sp. HuA40]